MTERELVVLAYQLASGNHLTEEFTDLELPTADLDSCRWIMTEDWPTEELRKHIDDIAKQVIALAKHYKGQQ